MERDVRRITDTISRMAALSERALVDCMKALREGDRELAYAVIIRDQGIDLLEKELDRLCLEFLVRRQPAGGLLRLAYGAMKISTELERVGDYAESVAHQATKLAGLGLKEIVDRFEEISDLVVPMLRDSVRAFVTRDQALAISTIPTEKTVDALKGQLRRDLMQMYRDGILPFEALDPCLLVTRRLERVSDQARNICLETLYQCTGESPKHVGAECYRLLFLDRFNAGLGLMAVALAEAMGRPGFTFESAGLEPRPPSPGLLAFLREKGLDVSRRASKSLSEVPQLDQYHVVIVLDPMARERFPGPARKLIFLDWPIPDPAEQEGAPEAFRAACEAAFQTLQARIQRLVQMIATDGTP